MARKSVSQLSLGIALPQAARERLRRAGIFVQTAVTAEHQNLGHRYVLRGVESGGAVEAFGHYVAFAGEDGLPLPYLCRIESLAVNGPHAMVIAPALVRAEMLRVHETYELMISRHSLQSNADGQRPNLMAELIFRGEHGRSGEGGMLMFWSRAGEPLAPPDWLRPLVMGAGAGARCVACEHVHYLTAPPVAVS